MKHFLAVFTGSADALARWNALTDEERSRRQVDGFKAWTDWVERHPASIVDNGSPLGRTKLVNRQGISDTRNNMAAYTIVRAMSHEAAARMFEGHPHFTLFPGEGVEIMECLPLPGAKDEDEYEEAKDRRGDVDANGHDRPGSHTVVARDGS